MLWRSRRHCPEIVLTFSNLYIVTYQRNGGKHRDKSPSYWKEGSNGTEYGAGCAACPSCSTCTLALGGVPSPAPGRTPERPGAPLAPRGFYVATVLLQALHLAELQGSEQTCVQRMAQRYEDMLNAQLCLIRYDGGQALGPRGFGSQFQTYECCGEACPICYPNIARMVAAMAR